MKTKDYVQETLSDYYPVSNEIERTPNILKFDGLRIQIKLTK